MPSAIGIIGAGTIAETQYLPALKKLGVTTICIYDLDESRAAAVAQKHGVQKVTLSQLYDTCDTLFLTTPPEHHYPLLLEIIPKAGRVVCEKPFVLRRAEAEELTVLASRSGCELMVAHIKRIFPAMRLAKQLMSERQPNRLLRAELFDGSRSGYKTHSGYLTQNPYGGVLPDSGSHALDCLLYTTGLDQEDLHCEVLFKETEKAEPSHDFSARMLLNGIETSLRLSRYEALAGKMNLYFEQFTLEVPFDLKPYVRLTDASGSRVISAQDGIFNYVSEAFKEELRLLLSDPAPGLFHARHFIPLTSVLEKLYFHA